MMTLSEALATNRPFKHKTWDNFYRAQGMNYLTNITDAYALVWQVLPEEKPPMRVWCNECNDIAIREDKSILPSVYHWRDCTEQLAKALAPYIKKELNL